MTVRVTPLTSHSFISLFLFGTWLLCIPSQIFLFILLLSYLQSQFIISSNTHFVLLLTNTLKPPLLIAIISHSCPLPHHTPTTQFLPIVCIFSQTLPWLFLGITSSVRVDITIPLEVLCWCLCPLSSRVAWWPPLLQRHLHTKCTNV